LTVRQLNSLEARQYASALAGVLLDCVAGGASVSFLASLTEAEAQSFFEHVADGVERGDRILLAAFLDARVVGTVQIVSASAPNQPHRADVAKLLVHRSARGQGIARMLMEHAEEAARVAGKTLLVLDTATGGAGERLYEDMGWTRVGEIPNYALYPDGTLGGTTIFWKRIRP
jgi:GNAT superfamily N-acetyltransferase